VILEIGVSAPIGFNMGIYCWKN